MLTIQRCSAHCALYDRVSEFIHPADILGSLILVERFEAREITLRLLIFFGLAAALFVSNAAQAQFETFSRSRGVSAEEFSKVLRDNTPDIVLRNAPESRSGSSQTANVNVRIDPRMVGGEPVEIKDNPWLVALVFGTAPDPIRVQFCGGSLIRPGWVITAAHCVDRNTTPGKVDVISGTTYYKYGGERVKVKSIIVHENWNPASNENDIALLQLDRDLPEAATVKIAAADLTIPDNTNLIVSGWGAIFENGPGSEILLGAFIPTVGNATCDRDSYRGKIKAGMLCAGLREGGLDSCQGDSGGAAVIKIGGIPTLAGIVSFGEGCARREKYGVYTRVSYYRSWIDGKLPAR
jgi:secreted trypsin-like serine protease